LGVRGLGLEVKSQRFGLGFRVRVSGLGLGLTGREHRMRCGKICAFARPWYRVRVRVRVRVGLGLGSRIGQGGG